jgi:hypothetical protein
MPSLSTTDAAVFRERRQLSISSLRTIPASGTAFGTDQLVFGPLAECPQGIGLRDVES